jgi:hypothetical protein
MEKPENCFSCRNHKMVPDPDPIDFFRDNDQAMVCVLVNNPKYSTDAYRISDRQAYKVIGYGIEVFDNERKIPIPSWCPLGLGEK